MSEKNSQVQPLNQLNPTQSSDQTLSDQKTVPGTEQTDELLTSPETDKTGIFTFTLLDDGKSFTGKSGYPTEDSLEKDQITVYYLTEGASNLDIENPWTGTWSRDNEVITLVQGGEEVSGTSIVDNITQSFLEGKVSENGMIVTGTWSVDSLEDKRPDLTISKLSMKEQFNVIAAMMTLETQTIPSIGNNFSA